jgi:hypothetical protein
MARRGPDVAWTKGEPERIPDSLARGVTLLLDLAGRGQLAELAKRVRIRREGGYSGFDVLLCLLLYFASTGRTGLKKFWEVARPHKKRLGALAERTTLPSPSSVSRALDSVELERLRPITRWVLMEMSGIEPVLRHPAVQAYDGRGEGWHLFDYDPTVHALRHRALPEDGDDEEEEEDYDEDDLPEARRRSVRIATPGYPGRKRGDVQLRRGTLQHAGSGAWLGVQLAPGNTERAEGLAAALDTVVATCERLEHPLSRALLRIDGEFGWVPHYAACRARGVPFVTRLTRPELLDDPEVRRRLDTAVWAYVSDSLSGPRRSATDLGLVTIPPGKETRRPDRSEYAPVQIRVVVSRYPREGEAEHGRVLLGWQYELFVIDADATAWPAPAVVSAFFGRAGQENRFAQEDREIGLDRIVSYTLAGQEFAVVVGLWVWNLRIARGFEADPPPAVRPSQAEGSAEIDVRYAAPLTPPAEPAPEREPSPPTPEATSTVAEPTPIAPVGPNEPTVAELLGRLDWDGILARKPGWSWNAISGEVVCPDGRRLVLTTVRKTEHSPGKTSIILRRPTGGCDECPPEHRCLRTRKPRGSKHLEISVPTQIAAPLRDALRRRRGKPPLNGPTQSPTATASKPAAPRGFTIEDLTASPAAHAVTPSLFLPAIARRVIDTSLLGASLLVHATRPPAAKTAPALVAESVAARQHRRLTWRQHYDRYALPPSASVRVEIRGGDAIRRWVGRGATATQERAGPGV